MQCVILAGGLGTRMRPYTNELPKALIPVCGEPFLDHQLRLLRSRGVTRVVLSIGHLGYLIRNYAGDGARWGLSITYVDEGSNLLGTGGALRLALDAGVLGEQFLVIYGDSYLPTALRPVWEAARASSRPALMTVYRNSGLWDRSNVIYKDGAVVLYEKHPTETPPPGMDYIDYGISVFRRSIIAESTEPGVKTDLALILKTLSLREQLAGFEVVERFYEIGSRQGLRNLAVYLCEQRSSHHRFESAPL